MSERTAIVLCDGWRLSEDGQYQWLLQRENPKAKDERSRWASVSFCGSLRGLLEVALPHRGVEPTDAATSVLQRLPATYEPGVLERVVGSRTARGCPCRGSAGVAISEQRTAEPRRRMIRW